MRNFTKILTVITNSKHLTFDSGGSGKRLITVMLIYRHCVIEAYSENLSDIIV